MNNQSQPINVILANAYFCNNNQIQNGQIMNNPQVLPGTFISQNVPFQVLPILYNNNNRDNQAIIQNPQIFFTNSFIQNPQQYINYSENSRPTSNKEINKNKAFQVINKEKNELNIGLIDNKEIDDKLNQKLIKPILNDNKNNININNNNSEIYKKIFLKKAKPKSLKKILINVGDKNEEKFTYLTTTYERNNKKNKVKNMNYSIEDRKNKRIKYNYGDYASNKLVINHPKLYFLNANNYRNNKLPMINRELRRINVIEEFSKLIPDNYMLAREEKINRYDEYMKAKELKDSKNV